MFRFAISILLISNFSFAQTLSDTLKQFDSTTINEASLLNIVEDYENNLLELYAKLYLFEDTINKDDLSPKIEISLNDSIITTRLNTLNHKTPFDLRVNSSTISAIKLYINKKQYLISKMLGMAQFYFPLFEQALIIQQLPIELKYLPIVESALNPTAVSRVGAVGLWQFMPKTAKMMGLNITSYVDERRDPMLSTKHACLYLNHLYAIYHDWSLALAAYNAGPGNVNKAIRRSGGKNTYWEIRPYLPKETQNYVPSFIAVMYMMEYANTHHIESKKPDFLSFEIDTVHVNDRIDLSVLESWLSYDLKKIEFLNPMYFNNIIPKSNKVHPIALPVFLIGDFIMLKDSIVKYSSLEFGTQKVHSNKSDKTNPSYYIIKKGDTIWDIAQKYEGISVADIKNLNKGIDVYNLKTGAKIIIK